VKLPVTHPSEIPDKVYFRIGEVSSLIGVDSHVLRYWETEFKYIKPYRARSNQRLYRKQDVEILLQIRALLHEQEYTISGARKVLARGSFKDCPIKEKISLSSNQVTNNKLIIIKNELLSIQQLLAGRQN